MRFHKYTALGNDYIVLDPTEQTLDLTPGQMAAVCDRHFGLGSDGLLLGPFSPDTLPRTSAVTDSDTRALRIVNPDGSEAETSGNGLRIFCRYLWDTGRVTDGPFSLLTLGGRAGCRILDDGRQVRVEMGAVSFHSRDIPVRGPKREVLQETMTIGGEDVCFCAATIGNPHCVVLRDTPSPAEAQRLGPLLESAPAFPNRSNVQFMSVPDRSTVCIEIWERGAGYTLASGSSASACAAVAVRLGLCDRTVNVKMPGGNLLVEVGEGYRITQTGPVRAIAHGELAPDLLEGPDR